jgi:hypothetical protein
MTSVKVKFSVTPKTPCENLYIVGSTSSLGMWDPKKATELRYDEETNAYVVNKLLPLEEVVEFKFVTTKDWNGVEKGIWNEEISNREVVPTKGLKLDLTIETFRKF